MLMVNKGLLFSLVLMSFVNSFALLANENHNAEPLFTVRPATCVLTLKKSHCQQEIVFEFKQRPANSICISIVNKINSKKCYPINDRSTFSYNIKTKKSVLLVIEDGSSQQVLGRAEFKITEYQPLRKRRRFSWGLL